MCLNCIRFVCRREISRPSELYEVVENIRPFVEAGRLKFIQGSPPLNQISREGPLLDGYFLVFRCARCLREFQLNVDAYHGRGGWGD
jgi:hypothetical protein